MMQRRVTDYIEHMLEAAQQACIYTEGLDKDEFLEDKRTQQAVILNIIVIGEAATKIVKEHPEFIEQHREIPWKNMRGMRNRIAHGYFDINLDIVWDTVAAALPQLIKQLSTIKVNDTPDQ